VAVTALTAHTSFVCMVLTDHNLFASVPRVTVQECGCALIDGGTDVWASLAPKPLWAQVRL
jgi:hypothetical protein